MSQDLNLSNVPRLPIGRITELLGKTYAAALEQGVPLRRLPSVMLWGPPGVGKSQGVRQLGQLLEERTGKRVHVTDVRLLLFNPIDLRGIPTANADKTAAIWLQPQIFRMDPDEGVVNILFLDEISAAPPSVQAAAYQITLDRTVGEHRLPENCIVIAAGNRTTDKSVAYKMPKALANRLMHFEVELNFESWRAWAVEKGIHPKVLGFLSFRRSYLMAFDAGNEDLAFATPRSWEMVSDLLYTAGADLEAVYPMVAGLIGTGTAIELQTWERVWRELPDIADIFSGKTVPVPRSTDALYALTASMTAYAREHRHDLKKIACSIRYAEKLPPDYSILLLKDYLYLEPDYRKKLMTVPEFSRWLSSKGRFLNGLV